MTIATRPAPACLLCARDGGLLHVELRDRIFNVPGTWQHRCCATCGLTWLDPRPEPSSVPALYAQYFAPHDASPAASEAGESRSRLREHARNRALRELGYDLPATQAPFMARVIANTPPLKELAASEVHFLPFIRGGKVLDVGCGSGQLLAQLQRLGWDVTGIEPDPRSAAAAARLLGRPVLVGGIGEVDLPDNHFDAIVLSHVIEHLVDPLAALGHCARALKPGGRIVITTPNTNSFGRRIFKRDWLHWDVPRHIFIYDANSLRALAEKAGLRVSSVRSLARKARWAWRASRMIQKAVPPTDDHMPSTRADRALAGVFQLCEHAVAGITPAGEELLLVATR
jgi:SAM-dependent methyltransferase